MLPPPVHAAKKEMNRILIPYSLGRKPKAAPKPAFTNDKPSATSTYSQKKYSMFQGMTGYDSDSDENEDGSEKSEEPVSFFSLDSSSKSDKEQVTPSGINSNLNQVEKLQVGKTDTGTPTVALPPKLTGSPVHVPVPLKQLSDKEKVQTVNAKRDEIIQGPSAFPQMDPDAPLTFRGGVKSKPVFNVYGPFAGKSDSDSTEIEMAHDQNMYYNIVSNTVNVLNFRTFYSILFWPKFCFLCSCVLEYSVEWQTV